MPTTTFTSPVDYQVLGCDLDIRGIADDDRGVAATYLAIKSQLTGRFWNGQRWQDEFFHHVVDHAGSGNLISQWKFNDQIFTETENGIDWLVFFVRSLDVDGNGADKVRWRVNRVDGCRPESEFAEELRNASFTENTTVRLHGRYDENIQIAQIRIVLLDRQTRQYFNGSTWQDRWTYHEAEFFNDKTWQLETDLPTGNYAASVRARDVLGNVQSAFNIIDFSVVERTTEDN